MLIIVTLAVAVTVWQILRHDFIADGPEEISTLDQMDGIVVPCPPDHGTHCRCTWR